MADSDKAPESLADSQATYDPSAEDCAQMTESGILSESQDFRLVDCEESGRLSQLELETAKSKEEESDATDKKAEHQISATMETEDAAAVEKEKSTIPSEKENTLNSQTTDNKDEPLAEEEDDEMDFIPSSQQESVSPMKTQLSSLMSVATQKRKASSPEEPVAKFQRTCSREDALSSVRKKLEAENDISDLEKVQVTTDAATIIEETQETEESCVDDDKDSESLQQVQQELVETLSQCTKEEEAMNNHRDSSPIKEKPTTEEQADDKESPKKLVETVQEEDATKVIEASTAAKDKPVSDDNTIEEESLQLDNESKSEDTAKTNDNSDQLERKTATPEVNEEKENPTTAEAVAPQVPEKPEKVSSLPEKTTEEAEPQTREEPNTSETKDTTADDSVTSQARKSADSGVDSMMMEVDSPIPVSTQTSSSRSRMSIEVIYDKATAPPEKKRPRELVEIDEDGEKIVLDSSQEDKSMDKIVIYGNKTLDTSYKTCDSKTSADYKSIDSSKDSSNEYKSNYSLTNGSADSTRSGAQTKDSAKSATMSSDSLNSASSHEKIGEAPTKKARTIVPTVKSNEQPEILSISDSEGDSFAAEERSKSKGELPMTVNHENSAVKVSTMEKEINVSLKLKCLIQIDDNTKEILEKVLTSVNCEPTVTDLSSMRPRNIDTSAGLADISGNDNNHSSPGSVTSNPQPYAFNPRLSIASTISSSSSASSTSHSALSSAVLARAQFNLPRPPARHAKKLTPGIAATPETKPEHDETYEQIQKEWKNLHVLDVAVMNFANNVLQATDLHNGSAVPDNSLERIRSSTPEVPEKDKLVVQVVTPKTTKRSRSMKRGGRKTANAVGSNGVAKASPSVSAEIPKIVTTPSSSVKVKSSPETSTPTRRGSVTNEATSNNGDELVGREVFAKWSDNKYYPGTVISRTKTKFKVNFYDGGSKSIIEDFIVPMPATLHPGLSVYATSSEDDYGSCGIIVEVKRVKDRVTYIVETDERERISVETKNIFLTTDQVQVLREEGKIDAKSPPSTPKHLGKVTLDNVVEGKRRSKRVTTPLILTPKAKRARGSFLDKTNDTPKPSASGVVIKAKSETHHDSTSDSNWSTCDENELLGIQQEVIGTQDEQVTKGPANRFKGKARSRKKSEDPEVIATLGPIPSANSNLFAGMSFLLNCAPLGCLDRFEAATKNPTSEPETDNEEEWSRKPFVRDRLAAQLAAGGGTVYTDFEDIPTEEYENTKLITNLPSLTKKNLLCLSVGIKAYNHQWVIRCCQENKIVNPSEEELPAGWSLIKQNYVEMFRRRNKKPFQSLPVIVVIPNTPAETEFATFWQQICQNAGGAVLLPDNPDDGFVEGTVVLTNRRCPSWIIEKAKSWGIPLLSTTWMIQCLIEGEICTYDAHPSFAYDYANSQAANISSNEKKA